MADVSKGLGMIEEKKSRKARGGLETKRPELRSHLNKEGHVTNWRLER